MSSQPQTDRRNRSRLPGQNGRQQWVPRGPGVLNTPNTPPRNLNENPIRNGGVVIGNPAQIDSGNNTNAPNTPPRNLNENPIRNGGVVIGNPAQIDSGNNTNGGQVQMDRGNNVNNVRHVQIDRGNRGHRDGTGTGGGGRSHVGRPQNFRRERPEPREGVGVRGGGVEKERSYWRKGSNNNNPVDSDLPQLVQEIQDKLTKGTVECMICYDMVKRTAPVWSCSSCYSIFHLNCIKKWARAPTSIDTSAEKSQGFNWRCPGCQSVQLTVSKDIRYVCFCGKRHDPPSDLYLTPHSCGEACGKPLEREIPGACLSKEDLCPHVCVLQCHPGPCPPCKAFAPPRPCPCGKKVITTRCSDRKSVQTCGQICDKLLGCGRHHCDRLCHVGPCEQCKVLVNASCFCKKKSEVLLCGEMQVKGEIKAENGLFSCNSTCGKKLRCGNHSCAETCHPGPCGECELLPSKVKTCCCGKTPLKDQRKSCLDPIPTCSGTCGKLLPCGMHRCKENCHSGSCPPCYELVTQKCRCGSTSRTVECFKTTLADEKFVCDKPCGRKKNCGRHRCSERCCPLSSGSNNNNSNNNAGSESWNPHFCSMPCEKKLRCGQHSCESFCHSGHCPPCLETIFTDLTCACGRTSIPPPLPCGTPPPSCQFPCSVPQPCGHQSTHSCHFGDCPPCSIPIAKECIGGHVVLRNIPCGSKDIRCNKLCGKTRRCGLHACARTCHPPPCDPSLCGGPSDSSGVRASCGQTCGAPRRDCRHTCTALCHPGGSCPDVRCEFPVAITCSCGRISATVPCDTGGSSSGFNADNVLEASILQKLPVPLQPVEASEKRVPLGQRKLACDDECAKLERKRVLADAFDINPPSLESLHFGENPAVSQMLGELLRRDPKWVLAVEERCKYLVLGKNRGASTTSMRAHIFCPMLKDKRDAVTVIAERWKLSISSAGREPKRFIVVHATAKSKAPPRILGPKGTVAVSVHHPPAFDPLVDMDPRLVVALLDLPSDAGISTLVLRFGGECELVWLNDKNALAVFSDPVRAATAMRRLDNGSVYQGASVVVQQAGLGTNPWGGGGSGAASAASALKGNPRRKAVVKESNWIEDSWGEEEWSSNGAADVGPMAWKGREGPPVTETMNRWTVLNPDSSSTSSGGSSSSLSSAGATSASRIVELGKQKSGPPALEKEVKIGGSGSGSSSGLQSSQILEPHLDSGDVVDDWEKAFE